MISSKNKVKDFTLVELLNNYILDMSANTSDNSHNVGNNIQ